MYKHKQVGPRFESYRGDTYELDDHPLYRWTLARKEQAGIRYDMYRGGLRLQLDKYGVALNYLAVRRNAWHNSLDFTRPSLPILVRDLIRLHNSDIASGIDAIEPQDLYGQSVTGPETAEVHALDRPGYAYEYGLTIEGILPIYEQRIVGMIERRADASEVHDALATAMRLKSSLRS